MELAIIKIVGAVLTAIIVAILGYLRGRWSKEKEILYSRKVDLYGDLVTQLLEFASICRPREKITISDYGKALSAFSELQNSFFKASLFMPDILHRDIQEKFTPANNRVSEIQKIFTMIQNAREGKEQEEIEESWEDYKIKMFNSFDDLKALPGPFIPLIESTYSITKMLKKDLGISKIGHGFYAKK